MNTRFVVILVVIVGLFAGFFFYSKNKNGSPASSNLSALVTNHIKGSDKNKVVLIEYGDFECPACYKYEPLVQQVYEKYKDSIQLQFRHFPLVSIHQHAMAGHRAAEAAGKQGKFWEMHDLLLERAHQAGADGKITDTEWTTTPNSDTYFVQYAQSLGLDIEKFKVDLKSSEVNDAISADMAAGKALDISGTPSFVLNGKKIESPRDLEGFSKLIDAAIADNAKKS